MTNRHIQKKLDNLPSSAGVYFYYDKNKKLIYIGKASVLRHRVRSYFIGAPFDSAQGRHDIKTTKLISEIADIKWRETRSVIEALILESNLIKKYQPKYNIREKDDKSFVQIAITREQFPQIISYRPTQKEKIKFPIRRVYGPYTNPAAVREILSIFRRVFGYRDCSGFKFARSKKNNAPCINYSIGLCPAPCVGNISKDEYTEIIKQIELVLQGKGRRSISRMKAQMKNYAKSEEYEKAKIVRDRIFAFEHIADIAAIKEDRTLEQIKNIPHRIEAYDISNLGSDFAVGSMVVFMDGEIEKTEYRHFRIKDQGVRIKYRSHSETKPKNLKSDEIPASPAGGLRCAQDDNTTRYSLLTTTQNDPAMMAQIIERRFGHPEWEKPDLILLDGGKGQLSVVSNKLRTLKINMAVMAVAKGPTRKGFTLFKNSSAKKIVLDRKFIESIRDEAHRFAISYHRKVRDKFSI